MTTYVEIYQDWHYLFNKISCARDMTGGYVDQHDLDELLRSPSKATAKKCLLRQIGYWFDSGIEYSNEHKGKTVFDLIEEYPQIKYIADEYYIDLNDCPDKFVDNP